MMLQEGALSDASPCAWNTVGWADDEWVRTIMGSKHASKYEPNTNFMEHNNEKLISLFSEEFLTHTTCRNV